MFVAASVVPSTAGLPALPSGLLSSSLLARLTSALPSTPLRSGLLSRLLRSLPSSLPLPLAALSSLTLPLLLFDLSALLIRLAGLLLALPPALLPAAILGLLVSRGTLLAGLLVLLLSGSLPASLAP